MTAAREYIDCITAFIGGNDPAQAVSSAKSLYRRLKSRLEAEAIISRNDRILETGLLTLTIRIHA